MTEAVKGTEKRAAQLMIRLKEKLGEPVPVALRKVAEAPVRRRQLSPEQKVEEVENALSVCRANAAECPDAIARSGMESVIAVIEAAINGEFD